MYFDPSPYDLNPWQCPCGAFSQRKYGPCGRCQGYTWTGRAPQRRCVRRFAHRLFRWVSK
jgi:hypothetical protein